MSEVTNEDGTKENPPTGEFVETHTKVSQKETDILKNKEFRVALDKVLQEMKNDSRQSDERKESIKSLKVSIMWLGMDMKELNAPNPYPNSYDTTNTTVDPTADGLKM